MAKESQKARLSPQDWIDEGFLALSDTGVAGLKAEVLALRLNSTKGSFYWHFKDMADFKSAMLTTWLKTGTQGVMIVNEAADRSPAEKLKSLLAIVSRLNAENALGGVRAEPAVREWARNDTQAAAALIEVDSARKNYIAGLFRGCGFTRAEALWRADMLYTAFVGQQALCVSKPHDMRPLLNQLLALLLKA